MTARKAHARPRQLPMVSRLRLGALASRTAYAARRVHRFVRDFEPWGIFLTLLGVAFALFTFLYELEDRQVERTIRAWQLVLDVPSAGSSRRGTFEYLNREFNGFVCGPPVQWASRLLTGNRGRGCLFPPKERESLAGIDANGANLNGADLTDADLTGTRLMGAHLVDAHLIDADLTAARLVDADLTRADLTNADLLDANLRDADLSGADLTRVNLTSAVLTRTNLTGATLTDANLTRATLWRTLLDQRQLDAACGYPGPVFISTAELTWRSGPCPKNPDE